MSDPILLAHRRRGSMGLDPIREGPVGRQGCSDPIPSGPQLGNSALSGRSNSSPLEHFGPGRPPEPR